MRGYTVNMINIHFVYINYGTEHELIWKNKGKGNQNENGHTSQEKYRAYAAVGITQCGEYLQVVISL